MVHLEAMVHRWFKRSEPCENCSIGCLSGEHRCIGGSPAYTDTVITIRRPGGLGPHVTLWRSQVSIREAWFVSTSYTSWLACILMYQNKYLVYLLILHFVSLTLKWLWTLLITLFYDHCFASICLIPIDATSSLRCSGINLAVIP